MKTVGILLRKWNRENSPGYYGVNVDILKKLRKFNVKTIGILVDSELDKDISNIISTIDECDGVILPGGENHTSIDFDIINYLYNNDIPTLGICLGMQYMGMLFNNNQRIKINNHKIFEKYAHKVLINKDSLLYTILNEEEIMVNSRHYNVLPNNVHYDNVSISAFSDDGSVEALEDKNKKFFLGVQWHPELLDDANSDKLFEYFINVL